MDQAWSVTEGWILASFLFYVFTPSRFINTQKGTLKFACISRHLNFVILRKVCILTNFKFAFLSETHLGIPVAVTVKMEASTKNVEPIEQFTQLDRGTNSTTRRQ